MAATDYDTIFRWIGILILVIISVIVYAISLYFMLKFKTQTKQKKTDPLFRSLLFTFATIIIVGTLELTGLIDQGSTKKATPLFFAIFAGCFLIFWIVSKPRNPLTPEKQLKYMLSYARQYYNAQFSFGDNYNPWLVVFKETYDKFSDTVIGNAILELKSDDNNYHKYLVKINAFNGRLIMIVENPPLIEQHRLTGERFATQNIESPYKAFNDYETEAIQNQEQNETEK